jgi:hypothetical protein
MQFVIKLTGSTGAVCWLSALGEKGIRSLTIRKNADIFQTIEDAHVAISKMPAAVAGGGLVFSVEVAG